MNDRYEYDEEIIERQNEIIDKLKIIDINEILLRELIELFRYNYTSNPHLDEHPWTKDYKKYYFDTLNKNVDMIIGLYKELSKDMFIYMMFSKKGVLNNED